MSKNKARLGSFWILVLRRLFALALVAAALFPIQEAASRELPKAEDYEWKYRVSPETRRRQFEGASSKPSVPYEGLIERDGSALPARYAGSDFGLDLDSLDLRLEAIPSVRGHSLVGGRDPSVSEFESLHNYRAVTLATLERPRPEQGESVWVLPTSDLEALLFGRESKRWTENFGVLFSLSLVLVGLVAGLILAKRQREFWS